MDKKVQPNSSMKEEKLKNNQRQYNKPQWTDAKRKQKEAKNHTVGGF